MVPASGLHLADNSLQGMVPHDKIGLSTKAYVPGEADPREPSVPKPSQSHALQTSNTRGQSQLSSSFKLASCHLQPRWWKDWVPLYLCTHVDSETKVVALLVF